MDEGFDVNEARETAAGHERKAARDSMFLLAPLRSARLSEPVQLRVRNVSAGGLMGEVSGQFTPGEAVEVELRGVGIVSGVVAWRRGERLGLAFDTEINPMAVRKPVAVRTMPLNPARHAPVRRPGF